MDRGLTLRTHLWLAGCCFILSASLGFVAFLKFALPWWAMTTLLGGLVAAVIAGLEQALAMPLERLARASTRRGDHGVPATPPGGPFAALEVHRLWRGLRASQDQTAQARQGQRGADARAERLNLQLTLLVEAGRALQLGVGLAEVAPPMLAQLSLLLGVEAVYLVPLRRHCPVPVLGPLGEPTWGAELRASGLAPWEDLLAGGQPRAICLSPLAPAWRERWSQATLWVVPLDYHGKPQGLLLAPAAPLERTWTPDELSLLEALSRTLGAALHPPRWSDTRLRAAADKLPPAEATPRTTSPAIERAPRAGAHEASA